jgi:hypothetical protein
MLGLQREGEGKKAKESGEPKNSISNAKWAYGTAQFEGEKGYYLVGGSESHC